MPPTERTTSPAPERVEGEASPAESLLHLIERSLRTVRQVFGVNHPYYADALGSYGRVLHALGRVERSRDAYDQSARIRERIRTGAVDSTDRTEPAGPASPRVMDARDAARSLALGLDTLYRLVRAGEIPHVRVGKSIRFRPEDLDEYLRSRVTRTWAKVDKRGRPKRAAKGVEQPV